MRRLAFSRAARVALGAALLLTAGAVFFHRLTAAGGRRQPFH